MVKISDIVWVKNGELRLNHTFHKSLIKHFDNDEFLMTAESPKKKGSLKQLAAIHAALIPGALAYYRDIEGKTIDFDKMKTALKVKFIGLQERYHNDGTPVIVKIDGEDWHMKDIPSFGDMSKDELTVFISEVIDWFLKYKKWVISINPPYARSAL